MPNPDYRNLPKCKSQKSRSAAYDLLVELVKGAPDNYMVLHNKLMDHHKPGECGLFINYIYIKQLLIYLPSFLKLLKSLVNHTLINFFSLSSILVIDTCPRSVLRSPAVIYINYFGFFLYYTDFFFSLREHQTHVLK